MTAKRDDFIPHEIVLAGWLFGTVSQLTEAPTDGIYADCLLALAFTNLLTGLRSLSDHQIDGVQAHLEGVARAIEDCSWLSDAVSKHISKILRRLRHDEVGLELVIQIVTGAANRTMHAQVIDCMRAVGSDGLGELANAVTELRQAA